MTSFYSTDSTSETQLNIDKEFQELIPSLSSEERELLETSIKAEGCRDAIVVWKNHNTIIDGHNRYSICTASNLPFKTVEREFDSREDVVVWIIRNQFGRRNLTPFVRSELALKLKDAIAAIMKSNQRGGQGGILLRQNSDEAKSSRTDETIAKSANVSRDTIRKVEVVTTNAPEAVKAAARRGDISTHQAYEVTRTLQAAPEPVRKQVIEMVEKGEMPTSAQLKTFFKDEKRERITAASVIIPDQLPAKQATYKQGDILFVGSHILICEDNTSTIAKAELAKHAPAALAFCDPPYNAGVAEWDSGDFAWSQDYLIDMAEIVAVTPGIGNIPDFMRLTAMPYKWSTATVISNGMTRGALGFGNWLYTALFAKQDSIHRNSQDIYTITINQADANELGAKRQKPPMYLSWLFNLLTAEGETIIDAFGGSGISVIVADKLKRRCICIEKDVDTFNALVNRVETALSKKAEAA